MVAVIDVANTFTNNTSLWHVILTNADTQGDKEQQNKDRLRENVNQRIFYYEIQTQLAYMNISLMPSLKNLPTKSKVIDHLIDKFFGEDNQVMTLNKILRDQN